MKHWFVDWLDKWAEESMRKAEKYRKAIGNDTLEAKTLLEAFENNTEEIVKWAEIAEEHAQRLKNWSHLAEDMLRCGLENLAISYYDAKQSIEPSQLPLRPQKKINWTLDGIAEQLELRMKEVNNSNELEHLNAVYYTICELSSIGMLETALVYYQRAIYKYPKLSLPALEECSCQI